MKRTRVLLLGILMLSFLVNVGFAQKPVINYKDTIPVDPNVVIGKLSNGLVYYIRKNKKPENRIELRLAVNAGSILETQSQLGLAHFVEHMCFNGTKNFPNNQLIDFLQKTGVRFGADINAYTSFDETVYQLQIPADNKELIDKGIQVIEDWAHNVSFDGKEIDKERGIITEEWRLGLGADDRMRKKYFPIIFKNSLYADRIPIGDIKIIQTFPHDTLRKFYQNWYRPNLQAVAIVGDIDVKEMEQKIIQHFGGIQNPQTQKERVYFDVPDNKDPLICVATDKEATNSMVLLVCKHKALKVKNLEDYKNYLGIKLFTDMLTARLKEIGDKPDAPFIMSASDYGNFLAKSTDAYQLYAIAKENQSLQSLHTLLIENERIKKFGFTQTELDRMKEQFISDYEKASKEWDKTESANLADEYVANFLTQEPIPGSKNEFKLVKKLLSDISLEEINGLVKKLISDDNIAVVVTSPEKDGIKVPTEADIIKIIQEAKNTNILAYVDRFKIEPLVSENLIGSKVVSKNYNKDLDYTELTFGNGVKAIVKTTDFKNDEILLSAYSPGGLSLYEDKDFTSAFFASNIINESGIGNFDNTELEKKLKGKDIEISPYIDDLKEGFNGKSSPKDFETMLQLTYLYCKSPRKDTSSYHAFKSKMKSQVKFLGSNPLYAFIDTLYKTSTSSNPRVVIIPNEKQIDQINLDVLYDIYSQRFSNAGDFKFFIVGNINVDSITPILEKYLGGLPVNGKPENWIDKSPKFPEGVTDIEFKKGAEPKSMVGLIFNEKFEWNDNNRIILSLVEQIFEIKLIEVIREELSGVYSPQLQVQFDQYPKPEFTMMVMFGCSPKNTGKLTKSVFGIINSVKKKGPTSIDVEKAKEAIIREREVNSKTNKFWLKRIENYYFNNDNVALINDYKNKVTAITAKEIQDFVIKYFPGTHYVRVVLKPEDKKK